MNEPGFRTSKHEGSWYWFDMGEWDRVTDHLSMSEIGAYLILCHYVLIHNGRPHINDARNLGWLWRCHPNRARALLRSLCDKGMLDLTAHGYLMPKHMRFVVQPSRTVPRKVREIVFARDGFVCAYCADEKGPFDLDHIHPYSRGGTNDADNLTVACASCNRSKGDLTLDEWRQRQDQS